MPPSRCVLLSSCNIRNFSVGTTRRSYASWSDDVSSSRVQSYISRSRDSFLNLSIEHYLLQKSPPDSTILFLYINRPSIIIGRNQNPWLEVNLGLLKAARSNGAKETEPPGIGNVDLVRRRSGGGTVFHDEGNVNWSIICPPSQFTRDKHAEMVVRALRQLGVDRSRVNERHDIVLDQGPRASEVDDSDTHRTPYTNTDPAGPRPLKVSGSAYKLTRTRSLHHGTCLLSSPNLNIIPDYLHSPAKPYIKARGVESVSSPVGNIGVGIDSFKRGVQEEFGKTYASGNHEVLAREVGDEALQIPDIRKGYDELRSLDWTFCQTPQFTFSSHPVDNNGEERLPISHTLPLSTRVYLTVRYGHITESSISLPMKDPPEKNPSQTIELKLESQKLHEIQDWGHLTKEALADASEEQKEKLVSWLNVMLPV